jgi:hypothetical protein
VLSALLVFSVAAAGLYTVLVSVGYWETVANIIMVAGAFYAFVIQRFEGKAAPVDRTDERLSRRL